MASVVGLLEERELAARERVEELREVADWVLAELAEAETAWHEWLIARQRVGEVLSGPRPGQDEAGPGAGESFGPEPATNAPAEVPLPRAARSGSIVPVWRPALSMDALAPHYQRILATLTEQASGGKPVMSCQEITAVLGLEPVPASVEGVRSKMKRLADRGWADEPTPGRFTLAAGPAGGS
ncbi:hypothetical protein PV721_40755 [Streptomyces sp. MB09-01]|uniref:hypothetical protein n=1 Tax=Streptomyces sp. MB09-01 TaxID=3028666 RepID=UPI0029AFACF0|nr:hypothetical protein [Streptomyces sp. MB09-01]MDX3540521.1 hypothetical protein [Streptomyces sp. MB09-01]